MAPISYGPMRRPPRPATSQKQQPATGQWQDGRFTSPEAEAAWHRDAYRQAVNADTWHLGDEIDDQTRDAILAGIGGPTPPMYRGPDGKYRFANAHTIEDAATRGHRAQHFAGKSLDQIAAARMPGEDEYVALRAALRVHANDNLYVSPHAAGANNAVPFPKLSNAKIDATKVGKGHDLQFASASDCAEERSQCSLLCSIARYDSDMRSIWGGSFQRCMMGCLSADCGGNPVK